jgi:hypothetical protein
MADSTQVTDDLDQFTHLTQTTDPSTDPSSLQASEIYQNAEQAQAEFTAAEARQLPDVASSLQASEVYQNAEQAQAEFTAAEGGQLTDTAEFHGQWEDYQRSQSNFSRQESAEILQQMSNSGAGFSATSLQRPIYPYQTYPSQVLPTGLGHEPWPETQRTQDSLSQYAMATSQGYNPYPSQGLMQSVLNQYPSQLQSLSTQAPPPQSYIAVMQLQNNNVAYAPESHQAAPPSALEIFPKNKPTPKHKCPICGKLFQRPGALSTHMVSHTGERPWPCPYDGCNRSGTNGFGVKSNMTRHMKTCKLRPVG